MTDLNKCWAKEFLSREVWGHSLHSTIVARDNWCEYQSFTHPISRKSPNFSGRDPPLYYSWSMWSGWRAPLLPYFLAIPQWLQKTISLPLPQRFVQRWAHDKASQSGQNLGFLLREKERVIEINHPNLPFYSGGNWSCGSRTPIV